MSQLDFAALLCSRLCHDLVSPVGAINNGLELLADGSDEAMREQVIDLLTKSVNQTANRLQFFRLAFGAAGGFSDDLDLGEVKKAITRFVEDSRVDLDWQVAEGSGSKHLIKIMLNMALLVSEALIRGGTLTVTDVREGDTRMVRVSGAGQRVILQEAVQAVIAGQPAPEGMEARTVPAKLAREVADEMGGTLRVESLTGDAVSLCLTI